MKYYLFIVFILFEITVSAQVVDLGSKAQWDLIELKLSKDQKRESLRGIEGDLFWYLEDNKSLEQNLENFHFLDINGDRGLDFIYTGYAGAENPSIIIYMKGMSGQFDKEFETTGKLLEVQFLDLDSPVLEIVVMKNDDCFDCLGVKNVSKFQFIDGDFYLIDVYSITRNTFQPPITFKKRFTVKNPKYYLRSSPEIINEGSKASSLFGNVLAEYSDGATGYALASQEDETGRLWWFVSINASECTNSLFKEKNGNYFGWMSSRYLEELD
ncbi:hypothetical protein [Ekhidna sp.]